ncbi:lipopolysaccharide biosynthesis [Mycobacterium tuberculosis]|nr:lipopolysaccharide biosynthesis [Mycobacterium tuberculosis]
MTDAAVLGTKTRGVILAAASGKTKKQELSGAVRALDNAGAQMLGVVVTMLPTKGPDSYGYGAYTYGSTHEFDGNSSAKGTSKLRILKGRKSASKKRTTARA